MNLVSYLKEQTKDKVSYKALVCGEEELTYEQLWQKVDKLSHNLLALGVKAKDKVVISLPTSIEYVVVFLSVLQINAIAVPLKQSMTSAELKKIIKECKPDLFFSNRKFLKRIFPFELKVDNENIAVFSRKRMRIRSDERFFLLDDLLNSSLEDVIEPGSQSLASINYTYRGYGKPLGAMVSHENYISGIETYSCQTLMPISKKIILTLPLSHIFPLFGTLLVPLAMGTTIYIETGNVAQVLDLITRESVDMFASVPSFYAMMLNAYDSKAHDLSSLKQAIVGGSSLSKELYDKFHDTTGVVLYQGYGLTECMPFICNAPEAHRPLSLGKLRNGVDVEIQIVKDGKKCSPGVKGEICIRGPIVTQGYFKNENVTNEVIRDGLFYTGDEGYLDENDFLYFTGLIKKIVKVGGNVVDLAEVITRVREYPDIIDAVLTPEPDHVWGNVLHLSLDVNSPDDFDIKKFRLYLRKRLASYKVPRIKLNLQ